MKESFWPFVQVIEDNLFDQFDGIWRILSNAVFDDSLQSDQEGIWRIRMPPILLFTVFDDSLQSGTNLKSKLK